jgi:CRISPR-associated endonuclease/helicase Cas3
LSAFSGGTASQIRAAMASGSRVSINDFVGYFEAVHGVAPFPWQVRLLRRVAEGSGWPAVLDLPTSAGKTAALDIAIFHLALEATKGRERRAPSRIALVVDRRLIVDDAFARAQKIELALADPDAPSQVRKVAARLGLLAERTVHPLLARRLRGGAPREDDWARTPTQPTVLCSTVDQVGSRLLFRGYGVSDRMKPIHAGLLGSDCLILLDEAHLAEPFRQTLASIAAMRGKNVADAPWQVALLSATPGNQPKEPFSLEDDDREHPVLARRLNAAKPTVLVEITAKQEGSVEARRVDEIVSQASTTLERLKSQLSNPAIGVVVNRVARARQVFERLRTEFVDTDVILVIGPARSIEREELAVRELRQIRTGESRTLQKPLVVVATQTIEAGVDIDLDGLVTEAAALDSLRQRFGRLNRAGRDITPAAVVLAHRDDIGDRADDPVYGDRIRTTWAALSKAAAGSADHRVIDFGIAGFPLGISGRSDELAAKRENAPILLPAYVGLWSQTSPIPSVDPEISLFLHGAERSSASVQIVWRADLVEGDFLKPRESIAAILDVVPPRSGETVEIPLWAVRAWLQQEPALLTSLSDTAERVPDATGRRRGKRVFRYAGPDDERRTRAVFADELQDGDLIVVPAAYGGCDQWGWAPGCTEPVKDLAESAAEPYAARRFAVRVTPELIYQWLIAEQQDNAAKAGPDFDAVRQKLCTLLAEGRQETASGLLDAVLALQPLPNTIKRWLELLRHARGQLERAFCYGYDNEDRPLGVSFVTRRGIKPSHLLSAKALEGGIPTTEDDRLGSTPGYTQTLDDHSDEVRDQAAEFAHQAGLDPATVADLVLAAYLHDAGKADPRFQAMLYGGNGFAVDETRVLAKSAHRLGPTAWAMAGLPDRWRHEALSVRIAREHPLFRGANDPELVLWLIGVHHGYGRPLFPHAETNEGQEPQRVRVPHVLGGLEAAQEPGPQSPSFSFGGCDWPQLFERVKCRYGTWGLAWLEAIVRISDHRASEAAGQRSGEDGAR